MDNMAEDLKRFLEQYRGYVSKVLEPTLSESRQVFDRWKEPEFWGQYEPRGRLPTPSPIHRIHQRIKRPESVVDKILRHPDAYPGGLAAKSLGDMTDALGARVVLFFLSGFALVDKELRESKHFEISQVTPPRAYLSPEVASGLDIAHLQTTRKESGYASVHYLLRLRDGSVPTEQRPWFELQVRTLIEDAWAEVEHVLGYKPAKRTSFAVRRQFQILSKELEAIDEHFNFLNEELSRFQEEVRFSDSDPLNAENFPAILSDFGLRCSQKEVDGLLKLLNSRGIQQVGTFLSLASTERVATIRGVYKELLGRPPKSFEVVANLAGSFGIHADDKIKESVRSQIAFLHAWDEWKESRKHPPPSAIS